MTITKMMAVKEDVLNDLRDYKVIPRESDSDCLKRLLSIVQTKEKEV